MPSLDETFEMLWGKVPFGNHYTQRTYFLAGAAAMAEQFAQGQGTVLQLIRDLAEIQTRNAQALANELRKLRNVQAEGAGLSHWVDPS